MGKVFQQCGGTILPKDGVERVPCRFHAKFDEDGAFWCGSHRPSMARERLARATEKADVLAVTKQKRSELRADALDAEQRRRALVYTPIMDRMHRMHDLASNAAGSSSFARVILDMLRDTIATAKGAK